MRPHRTTRSTDPGGAPAGIGRARPRPVSSGATGDAGGAAPAADATPGPELVARLARTDVASLEDHELIEHTAAVERALAWVTSLQHDAMVELARRPSRIQTPDDDPADTQAGRAEPGQQVREFAADEIAARTCSTARSVQARMDVACSLAARLPASREALRTGSIDLARARVLVDETATLEPAKARAVDARWAPRAARMTPSRLRRAIRRAAVAADPDDARAKEEAAYDERYVAVTPAADGMAELYALLPAVDAVRIRDVLTAAARSERAKNPGDERTISQHRADLLAEVFRAAAARQELVAGQVLGAGCEIQVVVALSTLIGLDDHPGHLHGHGPITADTVRELLPDSALRRIVTDPLTGEVLDVGRSRYRPSAAIARHVKAAHPRCTFPGCEQMARTCELDHVVPFPEGPTSVDNLRPRCTRHHLLKHQPLVSVEELPDGTTRWHMPTGHTYDNEPEPLLLQASPPTDQPEAVRRRLTGREPPDDPPF